MPGFSWPFGTTLRLHKAFGVAGFGLSSAFMEEWARFTRAEPENFLSLFCNRADERVQRSLTLGSVGPLEREYLESFSVFRQSEGWRRTKPALISSAKQVEMEAFQISTHPAVSEWRLFQAYLAKVAGLHGFAASKLKYSDIAGRPVEIPLSDEAALAFGPVSPRGWMSRGAINTVSLIVSGQSVSTFNIDSLLPGLGLYRLYDNWREAAFGAHALVHAHACLAASAE